MADAVAFALAESKNKKGTDIRSVVLAALQQHWRDQVAIVWTVTDVKEAAAGAGCRLTNAECREVLQHVFHNHDATQGISWATLEQAILALACAKKS